MNLWLLFLTLDRNSSNVSFESKQIRLVASLFFFCCGRKKKRRGNFGAMMKRERNWKRKTRTEKNGRKIKRSGGQVTDLWQSLCCPVSRIPYLFFSLSLVSTERDVRTYTHTHTRYRVVSNENVDLREKVERTEMREERKRPWSPGDGWDEENLPSYFPFFFLFFFFFFVFFFLT